MADNEGVKINPKVEDAKRILSNISKIIEDNNFCVNCKMKLVFFTGELGTYRSRNRQFC